MSFSHLLSVLLLFTSTVAWADVDIGDSSTVDCTVAKTEQPGTTCDFCYNGHDAETDENNCSTKFEGTDFEHVCSTAEDADEWTEVWCDGPTDEGCAGCSSMGPSKTWPLFILLGGVIYAQGRRARKNA